MKSRAKLEVKRTTRLRTKKGTLLAWRRLRGVFDDGPKDVVAWQRRLRRDRAQ